jgi:ATPase subunit of ABC transporter with duplicated ATPase domains
MLAGLQNVTFEFGARTIVRNATWHIHPNDRIGLVGYNGTGKSTLLKVFVGELSPSEGTVERGRNTTIGYLHQDLLSFDTSESILQVARHAFDKAVGIEKELHAITEQLAKKETEELLIYTAINCTNLKKPAVIILNTRPKKFCKAWVLPMLICKNPTGNLAEAGACGYCLPK